MQDYEIVYKTVKHITLRILPDGNLKVTAPYGTSCAMVEQVLKKKQTWILEHQQKVRNIQQIRQEQGLQNRYQDEGTVAYLGKQYPLRVTAEGTRSWHWDQETLFLNGCTTESHCRQLTEQFYRQKLLTEIIPALNYEVRQTMKDLSLPEPEFVVRKMRASWGICYSQKHRIVLNLWLAMAPPDCIRQVLVHEYVHLIHSNHSPAFYALLEQYEPQYRPLKHRLSLLVALRTQSE